MEPEATEQGVQHESHHVSIDTTPQVCRFSDYSVPRSHHTCDTGDDGMAYHSSSTTQVEGQ